MTDTKENFFIDIYPRPLKVAFLINPDNCPARLLDSIIEFNGFVA